MNTIEQTEEERAAALATAKRGDTIKVTYREVKLGQSYDAGVDRVLFVQVDNITTARYFGEEIPAVWVTMLRKSDRQRRNAHGRLSAFRWSRSTRRITGSSSVLRLDIIHAEEPKTIVVVD